MHIFTHQDDHLSGQTFILPVILIQHINMRPEKKKTFSDYYVSRRQASFFLHCVFACLASRFKLPSYYF